MKQERSNVVSNIFLCTISGLLLFDIADVWAEQARGDYYGPHMMWNGGWFGMFFGPIFMIIFIALTVAAVVLLVRWLGGSLPGAGSSAASVRDPLDILKERFARGEIDKDEYEERRRVLRE